MLLVLAFCQEVYQVGRFFLSLFCVQSAHARFVGCVFGEKLLGISVAFHKVVKGAGAKTCSS